MNIKILTKIELVNLLGINEVRFAKDPAVKRTKKVMLSILLALWVCLIGYVLGQAYALDMLGLTDYIPLMFFTMGSLIALVFGFFKARTAIYREKDLDQVSAYPISGCSIVASRIIRMYVESLIIVAGIIIPTMIFYGIKAGCGAAFYISIIPVCIIAPILPTAIAAWIGIIFAAIIARNRHKALTEVIVCLVAVFGMFALSSFISSKTGLRLSTGAGPLTKEAKTQINAELSEMLSEKMADIEASIPIIKVMADTLKNAGFLVELVYALISFAVMALTIWVIGKNFFSISRGLVNTQTHREYKLEDMKKSSIRTALVKKEAARYFSSGIYVSNTIVGLVMAVAFAISLAFYDPAQLLNGVENIPFELNMDAVVPYIIGMLFAMMSITASSVSIEGKNWWIMRSLPLSTKDILGAKLLFNLLFAAPFYAVAEIALLFTVNASPLERFWLLIVPALAIIFSILLGLFLNLHFPKMNWENEMEVVKQGAAVGLSMFGGILIVVFGLGAMVAPGSASHLVNLGYLVVMSVVSLLLYRSIIRTDLEKIR